MESFSKKVKSELYSSMIESEKSALYELLALLIFSNSYDSKRDNFFVVPENDLITQRLLKLSTLFLIDNNGINEPIHLEYKLESETMRKDIFLPISVDFTSFKNISIEKLFIHSFLRGVFIACGSIINPENEYHIEFCMSDEKLKNMFVYLLGASECLQFEPRTVIRRNSYVVYSKSAEKITDFLVYIGAKNCAMEFMQVKMIKEVRNNINRTTNFETANIAKTTNSATNQIDAIKKIKKAKKFEELPDSLKEIAVLRMENPYSSLENLAQKFNKKISKSGINHRLQKIMELSKIL